MNEMPISDKEYHISAYCGKLLRNYIQMNIDTDNAMSHTYWEEGREAYRRRLFPQLEDCEDVLVHWTDFSNDMLGSVLGDAITTCLMCVGDVAADPLAEYFTSFPHTINMGFTEELFRDIANNPYIVREVLFCDDDENNQLKLSERYLTCEDVFFGVDVYKFIDTMFKYNNAAQGCYFVACLLLYIYGTISGEPYTSTDVQKGEV